MTLTLERLYEVLHYDLETGVFTWKVNKAPHCPAGSRAGTVEKKKHDVTHRRHLMLDGEMFYEHRLAWFYFWGAWPELDVDHQDGAGEHNWIDNLREATHAQNCSNVPRRRSAAKLPLGTYYHRQMDKYAAQIKSGGQWYWLGLHETPEQAARAYAMAAEILHGEFSSIKSRRGHSGLN